MITIRKTYLPDDATTGSGTSSTTSNSGGGEIVRTPKLPRKDDDISTVAGTVAMKWAATPALTLMWVTQLQFAQKVTDYQTMLYQRKAAGSGRQSRAQRLRVLDKSIGAAISSIKVDIQQKFTKALAEAEYSRYGIVKVGKTFTFPKDRDQRLAAIQFAGDAADVDGTGGSNYGSTFWVNMHTDYANAISGMNTTDADISTTASAKNNLKKDILKIMRSLMLLIQANYPDNYEAMYRAFGWQKENY